MARRRNLLRQRLAVPTALAFVGSATVGAAYLTATQKPVVRRLDLELAGLPVDSPAVRIALLADWAESTDPPGFRLFWCAFVVNLV